MNKKSFIHSKRFILALCAVLFIALCSVGAYFLTGREAVLEEVHPKDNSAYIRYISFDKNYACIDMPITASFIGASGDDITYQWSVD